MSCAYADIATANYDSLANKFHLRLVFAKDLELIILYYGNMVPLFSSFLDYLNTMNKTGKIKFTMDTAGDTGLEFLDLKLKIINGSDKS